MTEQNKATWVAALERIDALATKIPSSSSFASPFIAREILKYAEQIRTIRIASSSGQAEPKTQIVDLMEGTKAQVYYTDKPPPKKGSGSPGSSSSAGP